MSVKLPVSRKIVYYESDIVDNIAYISSKKASNSIKFIILENEIYKVISNKDFMLDVSIYSTPEYIIKSSNPEREYVYTSVIEYENLLSALKIQIVGISGVGLTYLTNDQILDYIRKNIDTRRMIGFALYSQSDTNFTFDNICITVVMLNQNTDHLHKIYEITSETEICVAPEINFLHKVNQIIELPAECVIDIKISDETNDVSTKNSSTTYNFLSTAYLQQNMKTNVKYSNYILKSVLVDEILKLLKSIKFKLKNIYTLCIQKYDFSVQIDMINMQAISNAILSDVTFDNIAFEIKDCIVINLIDNVSNCMILDTIYEIQSTDEILFDIKFATSTFFVKCDVISEIVKELSKTIFYKSTVTTIFIGTSRIDLTIDDIIIKSECEYASSNKLAYKFNADTMPTIIINDNFTLGTCILDNLVPHEITNIVFKLTEFNRHKQIVNAHKMRQHFKYKIKESCVFLKRSYTHDNVTYSISNVEYLENLDQTEHLLGIFTPDTEISFTTTDECIDIIDTINETSRSLSIERIRKIAQNMENDGLYGMTTHVDKIIKEVLLSRTGLVDKNLLDLVKPTKGIILYGQPGTGKTTLAKYLGKFLASNGSRIKQITSTELKSQWHGESEGNIRKLFSTAIKEFKTYGNNAPLHILIIDEIDAILANRHTGPNSNLANSLVNQFLGEMDGLTEFNNCITIGITNKFDMLDHACLRPGRFGCHVHVNLPNESQRRIIFENFHKKFAKSGIIEDISKFDYARYAVESTGMSGATIESVYQECLMEHLNKKMDGQFEIIELQLFEKILNKKIRLIF